MFSTAQAHAREYARVSGRFKLSGMRFRRRSERNQWWVVCEVLRCAQNDNAVCGVTLPFVLTANGMRNIV
jgi:hypothetical protein